MIVVCGEALMDVFAAGDTPTGVLLDARIGGSPLNVATGLARLAQPAAFFGALSTSFLGDRLLAALQAEGVDTCCTVRVHAPATLGLVGLNAQGVHSYAFYGEGAADRQLPLAALAQVPPAAAYQFGSYAMVVEPVATTLRALVERECDESDWFGGVKAARATFRETATLFEQGVRHAASSVDCFRRRSACAGLLAVQSLSA